jgi:hypothetical protein
MPEEPSYQQLQKYRSGGQICRAVRGQTRDWYFPEMESHSSTVLSVLCASAKLGERNPCFPKVPIPVWPLNPRLFTAAARAGLRPAPESRSRGPTLIFYAASQHGFHFTFYSFRASAAHMLSPHYSSPHYSVQTGFYKICLAIMNFSPVSPGAACRNSMRRMTRVIGANFIMPSRTASVSFSTLGHRPFISGSKKITYRSR